MINSIISLYYKISEKFYSKKSHFENIFEIENTVSVYVKTCL